MPSEVSFEKMEECNGGIDNRLGRTTTLKISHSKRPKTKNFLGICSCICRSAGEEDILIE
jgi:hypothetical protein